MNEKTRIDNNTIKELRSRLNCELSHYNSDNLWFGGCNTVDKAKEIVFTNTLVQQIQELLPVDGEYEDKPFYKRGGNYYNPINDAAITNMCAMKSGQILNNLLKLKEEACIDGTGEQDVVDLLTEYGCACRQREESGKNNEGNCR